MIRLSALPGKLGTCNCKTDSPSRNFLFLHSKLPLSPISFGDRTLADGPGIRRQLSSFKGEGVPAANLPHLQLLVSMHKT